MGDPIKVLRVLMAPAIAGKDEVTIATCDEEVIWFLVWTPRHNPTIVGGYESLQTNKQDVCVEK